MSKKFLVNVDLGGNQLINARQQSAASAPSASASGQLYYNTGNSTLYYSTAAGTGNWVALTSGSTAVSSLNSLTGAVTIAGTSNQIAVNAASSTITLSLPTNVTLPGKTTLTASTTSAAAINIPTGSDPTTPASGDAWNNTGTLKFYNGTATKTIAFTDSSITGNASTATALQTARTINGVSFDGTANITIQVPVSTGITGLGTGVATFLATPSSANLLSAVSDETGTGLLVFATSPSLTTPTIGGGGANFSGSTSGTTNLKASATAGSTTITLPATTGTVITTGDSATVTNTMLANSSVTVNGTSISLGGSGTVTVPISTGVSGLGTGIATFLATPTSANLASAITDETGSGTLVFSASPTFTGTVTLPTGSTSNAPLKFVSGTNTTAVVAGAMEFDGTNLYFSPSTVRKTIAFTDSSITGFSGQATLAQGGTNANLTAVNGGIVYSGSSALAISAAGTSNQVLLSGGAAAPSWTNQSSLSVGSATNATNTAITEDTATSSAVYPTWVTANTGNLPQKTTSTKLTFTPSTGNLTSTTFNGLTLTAGATGFTIAGGTTSKTLTVSNTLTLAGTDGSTLNIGAGGTLGSAAFTASTAYEPAITTLSIAKGGTNGSATPTAGAVAVGTGTAYAFTSAGTSGQVLTSAGASTPTWTTATSNNTNSAIVQRDASGNFSATMITLSGTTTNSTDVATKSYVDGIASGVNAHDAVLYATTAALGTAGNLVGGTITTTYANGTLGVGATLTIATSTNWTAITIDGQSLTVNDRVLIKNQAAALQNGIYTVTSVGAIGNTTSFVFTRATDNDQTPELGQGDLTYVVNGTANGGQGWIITSVITTVGTSAVNWSQFSGASDITAGDGLTRSGNIFNVTTANSGRIVINPDSIDLATVSQTNTTGTAGINFVQSHTVDSYGRVTGTVSADVRDATTTVKGIASFDTNTFTVTTGAVAVKSAGISNTQLANSTISGVALGSNLFNLSAGTGLTISTTTYNGSAAATISLSGTPAQKYTGTITGDNTTTAFTLTHSLGTRDISCQVYQTSAGPDTQYDEVEVDINRISTTQVRVTFATAPANTTTYNVVVVG
jgi:hypothetical protein